MRTGTKFGLVAALVVGCGLAACARHAKYEEPARTPATSMAMPPPQKEAPQREGPQEAQPEQRGEREHNTEAYSHIAENPFLAVTHNPLSTFSVDVDTASYSNVRRFLNEGQLPPADAVRIEELINYFTYDYPAPASGAFAATIDVGRAPWNEKHLLARVGIKGRELPAGRRPPSNLVFLVDVSGSMEDPRKLPLLKQAFRLLVGQLGENDRVSLVVYAGASGVVLPPTPGSDREAILDALDRLRAGGSTNGASGIELAYRVAHEGFRTGGVNRVILATDGDFNVGVTSEGELVRLVEEKAKTGVYLTVLGFGMGNYKDSTLERLADKGNGNYAYIDNEAEARKVFVEQIGSTLVTIAKDVKLQVEFNPARVAAWRLVGYENRVLRAEDFNDDRKDAGEIGAGHTVTALYELVPAGLPSSAGNVDPLKYQRPRDPAPASLDDELFTLKIRSKQPEGSESSQLVFEAPAREASTPGADFRFAAAVAEFGMLLRDSPHKGGATFDQVLALAEQGRGDDRSGHRREFAGLVRTAARLHGGR